MNFADRMKEIIQKSLENNRDFSEQAMGKTKEFGKKSILFYKIYKLKKNIDNNLLMVGNEVYSVLIKKKQSTVSRNTPVIKEILLEIMNLEKMILEKEHIMQQLDQGS